MEISFSFQNEKDGSRIESAVTDNTYLSAEFQHVDCSVPNKATEDAVKSLQKEMSNVTSQF